MMEKTIKHIFEDYVTCIKTVRVTETPEFLGIDELKIMGFPRMITNVVTFYPRTYAKSIRKPLTTTYQDLLT